MVEDGEDWIRIRLEMTILKSFANFSKYTNDEVAPLKIFFWGGRKGARKPQNHIEKGQKNGKPGRILPLIMWADTL